MHWLEDFLTKPAPKGAKQLPAGVSVAPAGDAQAQRYAEGALRSACENIRFAAEGTRNHTLNAESWSIGQLIKAGHLDGEKAVGLLWEAAEASGLPDEEIGRTVPRAVAQSEARQVTLDPTVGGVDAPDVGWTPKPPDATNSTAEGHTGGVGDSATPGGNNDEDGDEEAAARWFAAEVQREQHRLAVQEEARRQYRHAQAAQHLDNIAPPTNLADFLNVEDPPIMWALEGLQPVGTRALLAAQAKAGKTTMVSNLIKALADRKAFLGDFLNHFTGTITLIDDELDERMLRRWLKRLDITNPERVRVVTLRGRLSDFNIVDEPILDTWAELLAGTDYLILDCLRPVLDACGLDENHEAGIFLNAFDELLKKANIDNALVVHHMGHSATRSRGDSRIMDWPDALWKLTRLEAENPASKRFFAAFGRDVNIPEQPLHYTDGVLVLNNDTGRRTEKYATTPEPWIIQTLWLDGEGQPRAGSWFEEQTQVDKQAGRYAPGQKKVRPALDTLTQRGVLTNQPTATGKSGYALNPDHPEVQKLVVGD